LGRNGTNEKGCIISEKELPIQMLRFVSTTQSTMSVASRTGIFREKETKGARETELLCTFLELVDLERGTVLMASYVVFHRLKLAHHVTLDKGLTFLFHPSKLN